MLQFTWVTPKQQKNPSLSKKIAKRAESFEADVNHVAILNTVDHENIIRLFDFFDLPDYLVLILELARGRDIVDRIATRGSFSEELASKYTRQILLALAHCHKRGIVHCDLKPENILFASDGDDSLLKVGDFGFAQVLAMTDKKLVERLGTPHYVAPEIITGKGYDTAADMWSLGVIVYIILSGHFPFFGGKDPTAADYQSKLFKAIVTCDYTFESDHFSNVSEQAKSFIRGLLLVNPKERMTAVQALDDPWISNVTSCEPLPAQACDSLQRLAARRSEQRVSHSLSSVFIHSDRKAPDRAFPLAASETVGVDDSTVGRRMATLVSLAYESDTESQLSAAQAISNACMDDHCRLLLVRAGCLRALASLAASSNVTIANQACLALYHIVQSSSLLSEVVHPDNGVIQALVDKLSAPSGVVARQAARTVCCIARVAQHRTPEVVAAALVAVGRLVQSCLTEHQRDALQCAASLAESPSLHPLILKASLLPAVASTVPDSSSVGVLFLVAVILQLLANGGCAGACEAIVEQALDSLVILAKHPAKVIKGQAVRAFVGLATGAKELLLASSNEQAAQLARQVMAVTPKSREASAASTDEWTAGVGKRKAPDDTESQPHETKRPSTSSSSEGANVPIN